MDAPERELRVTDLFERSIAWYRRWYFLLRLEEEILRAGRYERPLALIGLRLKSESRGDVERLQAALKRVSTEELRSTDIPGALGLDEYAVILPETDRRGGEVVVTRLQQALSTFSPDCRIAVFGEDGGESSALLDRALAN